MILLKLQSSWLSIVNGKKDFCRSCGDEKKDETILHLLSTVIGVITVHCIIETVARRIALGHLVNDFCRSCGDEEEDETTLHLRCIDRGSR